MHASTHTHTHARLILSGKCVSLSTSEAENVAASQRGQEGITMREVLRDAGGVL
jgi:hypothetical protein